MFDEGSLNVPNISVILPVYNAERYLSLAVTSILAQTYRDFECVIVNDGSTDGSEAILRKLAADDSRIKLISRPNKGFLPTLAEAIAASSAPLIARMDADDISRPDRFAKQVAYLEQHPEVVVLGGAYELIDSEGRRLRTMHQPLDHETLVRTCLQGTTPLCHPLTMIRRDALDRVGGYDASTFPAEDLDLWLRLSEVGRLACLPDVLLDYRLHSGSISETKQARQIEAMHAVVARASARLNKTVDFKAGDGWRSTGASGKLTQLLKYGWWAWNSGETQTARAYGWQAVRAKPIDIRAWKLLLTAWRKSAPRHVNAPTVEYKEHEHGS